MVPRGYSEVRKNKDNYLQLKKKDNNPEGEAKEQAPGREGYRMTENREQRTADNRRCQAITTKKKRCRNEACYYRIYEGNRLEYLCCQTHFQFFTPHPSQTGQVPPQEEG